MKRAVIGGALAVVGSMWAIAIGAYVQFNLVSEWSGSRFWSSASQLGSIVPFVVSLAVMALGVVIMCIEYFRKDN